MLTRLKQFVENTYLSIVNFFIFQLELFDLDEAFSSEKSRLAQITNKCSDEDIDYYVREAADILGVTPNVPNLGGVNTTKCILEYILAHVVEFKKLNQDVTGYGMDSLFNSKS